MDRIPKTILIGGLSVCISLVLIFNYAFHHNHHDSNESAKRFDVNQVEELTKSHITIAHRERTEEKLKALRSGGRSKLQVIFDFDRTLTKYRADDGKKVITTHDLFNSVDGVTDNFKLGSARLYSMYGGIETDPSIPVEEKLPFMELWIQEYSDLLRGLSINATSIQVAVSKSNLVFRDGVKELFLTLRDASVPVLIFSAGMGDVVKAALHQRNLTMPNVHVISNFLEFSENKVLGFKGRYIHAFNKNQHVLEEIDFKYAKDLKERNNVILMGDSLGDASMADGLPYSSTVLRLGFLNDKINENLQYYQERFDVVIASDDSMNVTSAILRRILYHVPTT